MAWAVKAAELHHFEVTGLIASRNRRLLMRVLARLMEARREWRLRRDPRIGLGLCV